MSVLADQAPVHGTNRTVTSPAGPTPPLPVDQDLTRSSGAQPARVPAAPRHSLLDDVLGMLTGSFVASLGLFFLKTSLAVTGGTAGLSLLLSYVGGIGFGAVFFLVNVPFIALALWKKGLEFTVRTLLAVALLSGFTYLHPVAFGALELNPVFGIFAGNLLAGIGILILFRHKASLGGVNVVALIVQDRFGWRAGYVQMAIDVAIVLSALLVVSPGIVLLSAAGGVLLNLVLSVNHRPGRYLGA